MAGARRGMGREIRAKREKRGRSAREGGGAALDGREKVRAARARTGQRRK